MFLRDYCLRPSCYECVAKQNKQSDITIADVWGIEDIMPEMNDRKGISLVLIRTEMGEKLFEEIRKNMDIEEAEYETVVRWNPSEYKSVDRPKLREDFFDDMVSMKFDDLANKYAAPIVIPLRSRIKMKIKKCLKMILNPILKKWKMRGMTREN